MGVRSSHPPPIIADCMVTINLLVATYIINIIMANIILDTNKPNIFLFGACDVGGSLNFELIKKEFSFHRTEINKHTHDTLDFNTCKVPDFSTSLVSLYTSPPSEIASRVYDSLITHKNLKPEHYQTYREILKYPYFNYLKKHARPNDILIISFSSELYTKFLYRNEWFTVLPCVEEIRWNENDPLKWLIDEYIAKEQYQVPHDDESALNQTWDLLTTFANDVHSIFKNRVILVNTHLTDLTMYKGKIIKTPIKQHLSYKQAKLSTDLIEHKYAQRITDMLIRKFRIKYPEELPVVSIDDNLFLDANHPHGHAPFHFDRPSSEKIGYRIYLELLKINTRTLQENTNVNTN